MPRMRRHMSRHGDKGQGIRAGRSREERFWHVAVRPTSKSWKRSELRIRRRKRSAACALCLSPRQGHGQGRAFRSSVIPNRHSTAGNLTAVPSGITLCHGSTGALEHVARDEPNDYVREKDAPDGLKRTEALRTESVSKAMPWDRSGYRRTGIGGRRPRGRSCTLPSVREDP